MGVINVRKGLQMSFLKNEFKRDEAYFQFIDVIRGAIKNANISKVNKRARVLSEDVEQKI
jgi:hypothetical protein